MCASVQVFFILLRHFYLFFGGWATSHTGMTRTLAAIFAPDVLGITGTHPDTWQDATYPSSNFYLDYGTS